MVLCRHKWVLPTKHKPNNNSETFLYAWQPIIIFSSHLPLLLFLFLLKLHDRVHIHLWSKMIRTCAPNCAAFLSYSFCRFRFVTDVAVVVVSQRPYTVWQTSSQCVLIFITENFYSKNRQKNCCSA